MLGLDNPLHILMVLAVVLMLFGAKRLPEMGKSLGEGIHGFRRAVSGDKPLGEALMAHQASAEPEAASVTAPAAEVPAPSVTA